MEDEVLRIRRRHMEAALRRWQEFQQVHPPEGPGEITHRVERGEDPGDVARDVMSRVDPEGIADAISTLREAVGITEEAQAAFWQEVEEILRDPVMPEELKVETAAFMGLVCGLLAGEQAAERGDRGPDQHS
jgi:hypothetical protein